MNKYIPKVGEEFEWRSDSYGIWEKAGECIVHSTKAVGYESPNGWINTVNRECDFRPIKTKADVELENLKSIVAYYYEDDITIIAKEIQATGFTIPKKVKRSDVESLTMKWSLHPYRLNIEICELLGDLVEQDDKGGAE